jgi:hypothetical protein
MHALVIGGTGMLAEATRYLAERFDHVSLVARRPERLGRLERIHPLALDYEETDLLVAAIRQAIAKHGSIDLVVAWIHSTAPAALPAVLRELKEPFRLIHVRGSGAADPSHPPAQPEVPAHCRYQQVILGFVIEGNRSRWLTHAEISQGVIAAIESDDARRIVGTVRPWEMRPTW